MADNLLVSIGMPVYNGGKHVEQALMSLLAQSYSDIEIIVADNASTDNTQIIVTSIASGDSRVRYFRHAENMGIGYNFDFTLEQAQGKYFMWAASDDVWDNDWVRAMVDGLSVDGVELAYGKVVAIDEESGEPERICVDFDFSGGLVVRHLKYFLAEEISGKACVIYGLYKTTFLRERKKLVDYTAKDYGADMLFVFDCMNYGAVQIDPTVTHYKRHAQATLHRESESWLQLIRSVLMFNHLRYYFKHVPLSGNWAEKILLMMLIPVKYLKSLSYNVARAMSSRFIRRINSLLW